jgi:cellulose synthase/poly-beta-1,6-N-acetylglucosamine synthase-like glycosyltransferase
MIITLLQVFFGFCAIIITAYLVRHYIFTLTVLKKSKTNKTETTLPNTSYNPTVSILIPAHNEERVIEKILQQMSQLTYPKDKLEVIMIDDASTDKTGQIADEYSLRYNFIKVLHRDKKVGGKGKAAALNDGIRLSTGEILLIFDADYLPQGDIAEKLVSAFTNPKIGAVQGRPVVLNEPENLLTRMIALERISGFRVDEEARDNLGLIPQFGGTVGGFRRSVLDEVGGFDPKMLTEDTDLTISIYGVGYKVSYVGEAECYEEAVNNWRAYWRQRHRWARGHMQVCFKHSFKILKSKKLNLKEKVDGLLLLHIYFVPILTLLSLLLGIPLIVLSPETPQILWFIVPVTLYSFVGNFAPFFEVGIGAYLDGRKRVQWLVPLMIFAFLYNMLICSKAFIDVLIGFIRGSQGDWEKTEHLGKGKSYITNKSTMNLKE